MSPSLAIQVHSDYLSAHSTLLRGIFSGVSPSVMVNASSSPSPEATPRCSSFRIPYRSESPESPLPSAARGLPSAPLYPRLLPSPPTHPTIYLPVPDPTSFRLLVHYMYFGSTSYIEDALDNGSVSWESLARNVEYLGMDRELKLCLGRWYKRWQRGHGECSYYVDQFDDLSDSDDDESLFGSDSEDESMTTASVHGDDKMEIDEYIQQVQIEPPRGRQRTPRRLGHAISDPGPIRGKNVRTQRHVSHSSSPMSRGMSN